MHARTHLILGTVFAVFCYFSFENVTFNTAFIIWISSWFLIDLDHSLRYSIKTKNFNPKRFWVWSMNQKKRWMSLNKKEKEKYSLPIFVFHNVEVLICLLVISYFYSWAFFVFMGFIFHLIFDWIYAIYFKENLMMKVSLIYVLFYNQGRREFR